MQAVFTGRVGGASKGPFAEGNLAAHVGDSEDAVRRNRDDLSRTLEIDSTWAEVNQVHGSAVIEASPGQCGDADGILIGPTSPPAAVFAADCLPVLLVGASGERGAVVHAGWRGLYAGVIEEACRSMALAAEQVAEAFLGPSIGACCYEVGADLAAAFAAKFGDGVVVSGREGNPHLDLKAAAAEAVTNAAGNVRIHTLGPCTHSPELFSYRGDGPVTGRQALLAWIR